MNTPIIKISDDQNEITHESGIVTVSTIVKNKFDCYDCCYLYTNCRDIPCTFIKRIDRTSAIFTLKQQTE